MTRTAPIEHSVDIDLFVIGAMKSATTGLCDWLAAQPGIAMSDPKEPAIFRSEDDLRAWAPRIDTLFRGTEGGVRVDGSTDYTKFPAIAGVPQRLARQCPNGRFVYMMRHPVARATSQYRFEWLLGGPSLSFEQALNANPQLVDNGRYGLQLTQWLEHFPPDRFLLVFAEAFVAAPAAQVRRVLDFLGLDDPVAEPATVRSNESDLLVRPTLTRRLLRESTVGRVLRPLAPSWVIQRYRERLRRRSTPVMSTELRERLESEFDADLAHLSDLVTGPDLTCATWHQVATASTLSLI